MPDKKCISLLSLAVTRGLLFVSLVPALCEIIGKPSVKFNSLSVAEFSFLEDDLFSFRSLPSYTL